MGRTLGQRKLNLFDDEIDDGAHQCLGLHLARVEMKILFEELLDRIETIELAGEPKRANSTFVGGLKTLPVRYTLS